MGGIKYICLLALIIGASLLTIGEATSRRDVNAELNKIPASKWLQLVDSALDSVKRQKRLEENLLRSDITVRNGSLSHVQLLDTLPNLASKEDCQIALKILKSSLTVYNSECLPNDIDGDDCRSYLEEKPLPEGSSLRTECENLIRGNREGHHAFRRLLEDSHYRDGFYEMFPNSGNRQTVPAAWSISKDLYEPDNIQTYKQKIVDNNSNLGLAQWAQFVEHDLSKPVSQSMSNGAPIECCSRDQINLQPRHNHPACAPILYQPVGKYDVPHCLNYVRSALAVADCNFGGAEQLNQATGSLDLSQLYGFTAAAERKLRLLEGGLLRSTARGEYDSSMLPIATNTEGPSFCARENIGDGTCFVSGDSRVNSSPFSILIYTIFMRNHNNVAAELHQRNRRWSDEKLFQAAKAINVAIYRRVVIEEWLPAVLGNPLAAEIKRNHQKSALEVSNEFAVAAIRFYFSMLPNELQNLTKDNVVYGTENKELQTTNLFELKEEIYKPKLQYTSAKLNNILESLLNQEIMKMDAAYSGGVVWHKDTKPTHADILAFDIQRGRDHGLLPYHRYLESCVLSRPVNSWKDFENFIPKEGLDNLKTIYSSWADVDLIVGGISERPVRGSVGPTFSCIISEQFVNVLKQHEQNPDHKHAQLVREYSHFNGTKLLCLNSGLSAVPQNIFQLPSARNQMVSCADV
ncbi:chorion peroxidase isoform X2 [Drosophila eugracilis]|uniref:chorion peroxidase isoform X2 n=1 Tax=Drosophila eugracilis TaxID=29029 RepID=UPI001BDAD219|nr:chorion peroxidase isoform X2 [Drosophila eugracilis]